MSKRHREYKRRRERQDKMKDIFACAMLVVIVLFLCYGILERAVIVHQINQGSLQEYTGSYEYTISRQGRSSKSRYIFTLENGTVLTISKSACENEGLIGKSDELTFLYSDIQSNPILGRHTAQSIATPDGNTIIRDIDTSKRSNISAIWILSILLTIYLPFFGSVYLFCYGEKWLNRFRQWKNKRNI